jgi:hypothetical protein
VPRPLVVGPGGGGIIRRPGGINCYVPTGGAVVALSALAREYAVLVARRRDAEAVVKELTAEQVALEKSLLERMGDEGIASLRIETPEGMFTLSPRRELWASCLPGHEEELAIGLRAIGYGDLVRETVNAQRLSAYVREIDAWGGKVPPEIIGAVKISEVFKIGVRRASS